MSNIKITPNPPGALQNTKTGVIFGDSITAHYWSFFGPNVTVTGTSAVVSLSGHNWQIGQLAWFVGWASIPNQRAVVTTVTANTYTCTVTGATNGTYGDGSIGFPYQSIDNGWWFWAQFLGNRSMSILWNSGISGNTTTQMVARFNTDTLSFNPGWVSIMGGINDIVGSVAITTIFANLKTMCQSAISSGVIVFLWTVLPLSAGSGASTLANQTLIDKLNNLIRSYAENTVGIFLCDGHKVMVDSNSTGGYCLTNYLNSDGLHPSALGSFVLGTEFNRARIASGLFNNPEPLSYSIIDNIVNDSTSDNLWSYLPNSTVSGAVTGGATGTPPQAFVVGIDGGTPTVVASSAIRTIGTDGDNYGYNCKAVATSSSSSDSFYIGQNTNAWSSSLAIGSRYMFKCSLKVSGISGSNLKAIYSYLTFTIDGKTFTYFFNNFSNSAAMDNFTDFSGEWCTCPIPLGGTTITNASWQFEFLFSGSGTALTVNIGRVGIFKQNINDPVTY